MTETTLTRKGLLAAGAGAAGVFALPAVSRGAATPKQQSVYKLVPNGATCRACLGHDKNSLFPTWKAANGNRAHIGCNCTPVAGTLDFGTFVALFGNPKKLEAYRVDLRSARVRAVLKNNTPTF